MTSNNQKISSRKKNHRNVVILIAMVSLGFFLASPQNLFAEETPVVPAWLKLTTVWWSESKITDQEYLTTLQYLIDTELLVIPEPEPDVTESEAICGSYLTLNTTASNPGQNITSSAQRCITIPGFGSPGFEDELELITNSTGIFADSIENQQQIIISWIKMLSFGWSVDTITDQDFIDMLQFLVEYKVLEIPEPEPEPIVVYVPEQEPEEVPAPNIATSWTNVARIGDFFVEGHPDVHITEDNPTINQAEYFVQFTLIGNDAGERDCTTVSVNDLPQCLQNSMNRAGKTISSDGTISLLITDKENRLLYLDSFSVRKSQFERAFDTATDEEYLAFAFDFDVSKVKKGYGTFGTAKLVFTDRGGNSFSKEFDSVSIPQFG